MTLPVPREDVEQMAVVRYCDLRHIPRFRVPNETYTSSWMQKQKNKNLGVSAGVPDLFLIVNDQLIAIEMKRIRGSTTSQEQKDWLARLEKAGIPAYVCKGADAAIAVIEQHLKS